MALDSILEFRRYYSPRGFDAAEEVAKTFALYEHVITFALRKARTERDGSKQAALLGKALEAARHASDLMQDCGLVDRRLGTLFVSDDKRVERIPSGEEMQRRFDRVTVRADELVSEAERDWLYGDAAAAEAVARGEFISPTPAPRASH